MNPILQSSQNPEKLSMTIKGLLIGLVPLFIAVLSWAGVNVSDTAVVELVESVTTWLSLTVVTVGALRKFWNVLKG